MAHELQRVAPPRADDISFPASWPLGSRSRVLAAMIEVVDARGYAETRVRDLLALARMSRRTFYREFDNVEDCFFAAYQAVRDDTLAVLDRTVVADASPQEQLSQSIDALLAHFAAWPTHGMLVMVHVAGAGPVALAEHERTIAQLERRLIACLGPELGSAHGHPHLVAQAIIGAIQRLVQLGLPGDQPQALKRLGPTLTAVALRMAA
jgi:AcrR family transcriptional regulator